MNETGAIDTELGEVIRENEAQIAQRIAEVIAAKIQQGPRPAVRDAHPKAHGCVLAEFRVKDELPTALAQGVFVPGKIYQAYIRFSNGNSDFKRHDAKGDARGMAIKLLDVPGEKILAAERGAKTQDFIMINHPVFFIDDPSRYLKLVAQQAQPGLLAKLGILPALGFRGLLNLIAMTSSKIASPLQTRYWSQVPYRLGDPPHKQVIKFRVLPHLPEATIPRDLAPDFLRETMIKQLEEREAQFDFEVQPRTSPSMSVETAMIEWKERDAPFYKVATITIPRQTFATPERDRLGENLSFNPWHALPQHRPLGAVNRVRRVVYEAISKKRHELNGTVPREPGAVDADPDSA